MIDFLFLTEFEKFATEKSSYRGNFFETRGLCFVKSKNIIINLGAVQWKFYTDILGVSDLIENVCKTVAHESIHLALTDIGIDTKFSDGEELLCLKLAEQI